MQAEFGFGQSISSTIKHVWLEEVSRKFTSSYITLVMSAGCAYVKCSMCRFQFLIFVRFILRNPSDGGKLTLAALNEKAEFDKRLDSKSWDCADMAECYRANAEVVNAEVIHNCVDASKCDHVSQYGLLDGFQLFVLDKETRASELFYA